MNIEKNTILFIIEIFVFHKLFKPIYFVVSTSEYNTNFLFDMSIFYF